jgi:DNA-binding transcriptional LysR family regulator
VLQAEEVLRDQKVDLAISDRVPLGFLGEPLVEVEFVAVAHPDHPLLQLGREITAGDFAQHIQIEVGQVNLANAGRAPNRQHMRRWAMSSFDTVVAALCEGHGYAWLPAHRIRNWLDRQALVRLPLSDKTARKAILYLMHGRPWVATAAASRFAEVLRDSVAESMHEGESVLPKGPVKAIRSTA